MSDGFLFIFLASCLEVGIESEFEFELILISWTDIAGYAILVETAREGDGMFYIPFESALVLVEIEPKR